MAETRFPELPVMLVDDESEWLRFLSLSLSMSAGIDHVEHCTDSRQVLNLLEQNNYSLVLLDLNMPFLGGEQLLGDIKERFPHLPVIIISGVNQIETAIRCIKMGADDFFVKTDPRERVANGVLKILKHHQVRKENRQLTDIFLNRQVLDDPIFSSIVTCSPKMLAIFAYIKAIAKSDEPVLITGESGVGKELIARTQHGVSCPDGPWVAVNAAGLDDAMFADTLFGHVRGAYTGAERDRPGMIDQAQNGILFLDEISYLSMTAQLKLLRR